MLKKEVVVKMKEDGRKKMEEQKKAAEEEKKVVKGKLADIGKAITDVLAKHPDQYLSLQEIGAALKASKIVCATIKKFEPPEGVEDENCHKCQGCEHEEECGLECQCDKSKGMCQLCLSFLFQVIQFMAEEKEVDLIGYRNEPYVSLP